MRSVTCVIPAHNEGKAIKNTISEIDSSLAKIVELTIYVSEDGSKDDTRDQVESAALAATSKVVLSPESSRLGYSKAVQQGIRNANTELIWFMDSDGQYFPEDVLPLIEAVSRGTVVVGFRNPRNDSIARKLYSKLFGIAYRIFGFPQLIDPSSPFVVAYLDDVKDLGLNSFHLDYGYWWEFQARVSAAGLRIKELPVRHKARFAGETQVYTISKLPKIISSHLSGLSKLRSELKK
jgi:glycosyltransferase involved in cell wall biosynthesis